MTMKAPLITLLALGVGLGTTPAVATEVSLAPAALASVKAAIEAALTVPVSRLDILGVDGPATECRLADPRTTLEVPNPVEGSGRVAMKATGVGPHGTECQLWLWARVRILGQVPVARRAIRAGEPLAAAVTLEERELRPGHRPVSVCAGCVADRFIGAGQVVEAAAMRSPGLSAGEPVKVLLVSGTLTAEQIGRAVPCGRGQCAVLPSGKHVEGTVIEGRLVVNVP